MGGGDIGDDSGGEQTLVYRTSDAERRPPDEHPAHLIVFHNGSSSLFPLPPAGELLIGRGENAELRIAHSSVSRAHARLTVDNGRVRLADLGSHNGTRVNGIRIASEQELAAGDVVSLGPVTLVLERESGGVARRSIAERSQLRERIGEEVARAIRFARPLTLVAIDLRRPVAPAKLADAVLPRLEPVNIIGLASPSELVIVLPELAIDGATSIATAVVAHLAPLAPEARAGMAACPQHAADGDALTAMARAAAAEARAGQVIAAHQTVTTRVVGEHRVLIADPAMMHLYDLIGRVAASDLPVLILGETGVGKEVAAASIHFASARHKKPLVAINCAAIHEPLLESELFGYERGAFSGATTSKPGRLESAAGGTVLLDEVGELSATAQAKLLRVVETKRISRLGSVQEREIDIRLVCATNRNLEAEIERGRFREDLYFRISAATVNLPPLRDRPGEIQLLASSFLQQFCNEAGGPAKTLSAATRDLLARHRWPGNVRELKNLMHYVATVVPDAVIEPHHVQPRLGTRTRGGAPSAPSAAADERPPTPWRDKTTPTALPEPQFRKLEDEVRELERDRIARALEAAHGHQGRAAELIGVPLRTFTTKMRLYGLNPPKRGK